MSHPISVVLQAEATLGEGPVWDAAAQRLLWVDIVGQCVGELDPATGQNRRVPFPTLISAVAPNVDGTWIVATPGGISRVDPSTGVQSTPHAPPDHDASLVRFNDGKCDAVGRFIAGTMSLTGKSGAGSLYSFAPDGSIQTLLRGVSMSNGLGWTADGSRMFYVDTPSRQIAAFDYDLGSGLLHKRRVVVEVSESLGFPDGLTVDAEGMIWLALWGGSALTRWDPNTGRLLERQTFPASQITSCAFGGSDFKTLFVTSARDGLSPAELANEPLAGAIFAFEPGVCGIPSTPFGAKPPAADGDSTPYSLL